MHPHVVHDRQDKMDAPSPTPKTPGNSSAIKPPMSEMHPSKVHSTMAPPSSSLRLGFTDIKPTVGKSHLPIAAQSTPTKVGINVPSGDFTFRFARQPHDLQLGPEAQRMMDDLREEALKIKQDLIAKREAEKVEEEKNGRKIAKAKGKAGRYSAVHMAEFKKMDSIENHPSAFRAAPGRSTPVKNLKRTQSKANLDDSKVPPATTSRPGSRQKEEGESQLPAKRVRQRVEDDATTNRPLSQDSSNIPRPKSSGLDGLHRARSNASLMTPTKSSLARARATGAKTPSAIKPPSMIASMKRPVVAKSAMADRFTRALSPNITVRSPSGRLGKAMSFLRGEKFGATRTKSSIPLASDKVPSTPTAGAARFIKTAATPTATAIRLDKPLPSLPAPGSTSGALQTKQVAFTPETKRVLATQTTPSPVKSAIPRSTVRKVLGEVHYPTLDSVLTGDDAGDEDEVSYPDLSLARPLPEPPVQPNKNVAPPPPSAPGTFTFRSDKTISFGETSPQSFGASPGHSTVRQVRPSIAPPFEMPGSFPTSVMGHGSLSKPHTSVLSPVDKENEAPFTALSSNHPTSTFKALPHGILTKKRHRVATDEEEAEQEAQERAAKKRRNEIVPEGEALLAPRLLASGRKPSLTPAKRFGVPSSAPGTPSPKKKAGISLSRLNMLSKPKVRK